MTSFYILAGNFFTTAVFAALYRTNLVDSLDGGCSDEVKKNTVTVHTYAHIHTCVKLYKNRGSVCLEF